MHAKRSILVLLVISSLFAPARGADWYVDARNGNDANNGQSPTTAWKTLTHAVSTLVPSPTQQQRIHAAPGVYDGANGESFPLLMKPGLRIIGDAGSASTFLESPATILLGFNSAQSNAYTFDVLSGADGLTLRNSLGGIDCSTNWTQVSPSFHDLVIEDMTGEGVSVLAWGPNSHFAHPTFDHVTIATAFYGIEIRGTGQATGSFGSAAVNLTDCVVRDCSHLGIFALTYHGTAQSTLTRCRILRNLTGGIGGEATLIDGSIVITAHSSLIAANGGGGIGASGSNNGSASITITDSTIANNSTGVGASTTTYFSATVALNNCILFGNHNDVFVVGGGLTASYCDTGDGSLNGHPGCFNADPMFISAANGEYRLSFGSPCIDIGDPASNGSLDLLGHTRPYDGDLDTVAAVDIGAYEFEPLHRIGTPKLGEQFGFEFWGATGSGSTLFLAREPLLPPQSTPFGDLYLGASAVLIATVPVHPGPPFVLRRTLANDPALIGTTYSFQALTDSTLAPQGKAYTNPTSFVVLP